MVERPSLQHGDVLEQNAAPSLTDVTTQVSDRWLTSKQGLAYSFACPTTSVFVLTPGGARRRRAGAVPAAPETETLKEALSAANFTLAAQVDLVPREHGTRALRRVRGITPTIEVTVGASESAVVLVEECRWRLRLDLSGSSANPMAREACASPRAHHVVQPRARRRSRPATRGPSSASPGLVLDWIADALAEPVRAYVLKFVTQLVIDIGVDYVEGDHPTGLVSLAGEDPAQWRPGGATHPSLPKDRAANILLMMHGPFSSTAGSFGALVAQKRPLAAPFSDAL